MSNPYLAEIRVFSFNFPPKGWAFCNGQLLPINQNQALFALLGTTYGGNGTTTFGLPDLQTRIPMHVGNGHALGEKAGESAHRLTLTELPQHVHTLSGSSSAGGAATPAGNSLASPLNAAYSAATDLVPLQADSIANVGGSQPHENQMPYLVLSFCIALQGIFPSRN